MLRSAQWRLTRAARAARRLSPAEALEALLVVLLGILAEVLLRLRVPLPRICRLYGTGFRPDERGAAVDTQVVLPLWAIRRARLVRKVMVHWPSDGPCLRHSLVLGMRLRRLEPVLRLGIHRPDDGPILAHAWIEVRGASLDPTSYRYLDLA
jgi:hypothetical protein